MPELSRQFQIPGVDWEREHPRQDPNIYYRFSSESLDRSITDRPLHMGTEQSAIDRATAATRYRYSYAGAAGQPEEVPEQGVVTAMRIRGPMLNDPETRVSDAFANMAWGEEGAISEDTYTKEAWQEHHGTAKQPFPLSSVGERVEWRGRNRGNVQAARAGLYYRNVMEDPDSTSAVVPGLPSVEILRELPYTHNIKNTTSHRETHRGLDEVDDEARRLTIPGGPW